MIAVVVPVFNKAETLLQTVPAVLAQEEVSAWIWVDDGSTDGSREVLTDLIRGEPRAKILPHGANVGRAAARNTGAAATDAETIVFFDADVVPGPLTARRLADEASRENAVAAVGQIVSIGIDTDDPYHVYLRRHPRGPSARDTGKSVSWRYFIAGTCALRADALREVGGFNEAILYGEDLALAQALQEKHPSGLVYADASVHLLDVGDLSEALANVEAFGVALAHIAEASPLVYETMGLDLLGTPAAIRYRIGASSRVASAIRATIPLLPERGVAIAVRYLLGHHLLVAHARARSPV